MLGANVFPGLKLTKSLKDEVSQEESVQMESLTLRWKQPFRENTDMISDIGEVM